MTMNSEPECGGSVGDDTAVQATSIIRLPTIYGSKCTRKHLNSDFVDREKCNPVGMFG
jgi:hypothetical protein